MQDGSKTCFVIMPFGGESEEKVRHYDGVYHSIIVPAAARAGYRTHRSDSAGEPGNITQSVIRDLLDADIVIADLTEANANVFFELGIRHAFRKSGTVHVVDERYNLPFDLHQYRTIKYSENLAELPGVIDEIFKAIRLREAQYGKSDNPVHDAILTLPIDIRSTGDSALKSRIDALERAEAALIEERDEKQRRLDRLDPTGALETGSAIDLDRLLDDADQRWTEGGQHVLLELTRAANTGGSAAFRTQLRTALRSPYLTESDFIEMALMCAGLSLEQHSLAVLEVALDRYPSNGSLLTRLASAYLSSANRDLRSKGRIMLEGYLGIELENGEPVIRGSRVDRIKQAIGRLCDVYSQMDKPEWVYSMTSSAEKLVADPVVMRNKAHALGKLGRREESEAQFQKAIARFPEDDTVHAWYANFLESEGRFEDAYAQEEEALRLDPASGRRWLNIALSILSYGNCRIRNVIVKGLTLSREQRRKYAVPILARAVELNPSLRAEVVSTLVKVGALGEANAFSEGSELTEGYDTEVIDGIEQLLSTSRSIGVLASKPREEPERSGVLETVSDDTYSNANSHDTLTGAVDR